MREPLPIDPHLPEVLDAIDRSRRAVIVSPPGTGKTTRLSAALALRSRTILLQPRRIAARALATRIASENGWTVGNEVGWHIRHERRVRRSTRLVIATEGILVALFRSDPLLTDFATIIFDEFHERSIHSDLGLAFAREAFRAREDLRIVVMSATIDPQPVADFLGGATTIPLTAPAFRVDLTYEGASSVAAAARRAAAATRGDVLCFLPGVREIEEARRELAGSGHDTVPLHGSLDSEEQQRALRRTVGQRIVLSTNIAETSLTVDGVTAVIDSGLQRLVRYDPAHGVDALVTERITQDAADQRAGRAGRQSDGTAIRLWHARTILRPAREPEINRIDLSRPLLEVIAHRFDVRTFGWFQAPEPFRLDAALELLASLGAIRDGRITKRGEQILQVGLHPRFATLLLETNGSRAAAAACVILSQRSLVRGDVRASDSDLLPLVDEFEKSAPRRLKEEAELLRNSMDGLIREGSVPTDSDQFVRATFAAFADRIAQRREPRSDRLLLSSGAGARLARESGVASELIAAVELITLPSGGEPLVSIASSVRKEWLTPSADEVVHEFDAARRAVRATRQKKYGAIVLSSTPVPPDREIAAEMLAAQLRLSAPCEEDSRTLRRLTFAGIDIDPGRLAVHACSGRTILPGDGWIAAALPREIAAAMARLAPRSIRIPSGREARIEYREDGEAVLSVRLQELFGMAESPRIGPRRQPLLIELLAPNGRPVQVTRDLRNFWNTTYAEVRKELRARYPKHPWPDDPWNAEPTRRTRRN